KEKPTRDKAMIPASVSTMLAMSRADPFATPLSLAFAVIDEKRRKRHSLHTLKPSSSLNEPPADPFSSKTPAKEEDGREHAESSEPVELPEEVASLFSPHKVAYDPELEECLPPNTDARSATIRHLSRQLSNFLAYGFDENVVPEFLLASYRSAAGGPVTRFV